MNQLSLDSRLTVSPEVVSQELEGELVVLSLDRGEYYGLNPTGTCIWNGFAEGVSLRIIADRLVAEFQVDVDRARADVVSLAQALLDEGLATLADTSTT